MNKQTRDVMFSSRSEEWETPWDVFTTLNKEFKFEMDVCATDRNKKTFNYISKEQDGLSVNWHEQASCCWMNPPYGRGIGQWVKKAHEESLKGVTTVCLLPSRTDTKWFHDYILDRAEIRFIRGRLKFGGCKNSAPFPSMIVIFRPVGACGDTGPSENCNNCQKECCFWPKNK